MRIQRVMRGLAACALPILLTACGGMLKSDRPATHTWWLEPLQPAAMGGASAHDLTVNLTVVPGLDTDRILTLDPEARFNHYAGARWAENMPDLLESLVVRSMRNAGVHAEVSARQSTATGSCHLQLEVSRFYARLDSDDSTVSVEVEVAGSYDCADGRATLGATASVPASGNRMPVVVAAFQRGFDQVMQSLLDQM